MSDLPLGSPRQIVLPVDDVAAALDYYRIEFGLAVKFRDSNRWAALEWGDHTLALAGGSERPMSEGPLLAVKVADLKAAMERLLGAGGSVVTEATEGPHERRIEARDRFSTPILLYQPRQS